MTKKSTQEIALFRYGVIVPLLTHREKYSSDTAFFNNESTKEFTTKDGKKVYLSANTIKKWYYAYKKYGFNGLEPKERKDKGVSRKISLEVINEIKELINEYPRLKATDIYKKLLEKEISENNCSYDTVNRIYKKIKQNNCESEHKAQMLRYEAPHVNDIWCADSSVGPYLYGNKTRSKLWIIAFIDDASRMITGCKIFENDNTVNLMATLKHAIKINGKPKMLNMDNGKNYRSKQMAIVAAKLGVSLHYDPVKTPQSKAKIERFFRTLKEHWLAQINYNDFKTIEEYQRSLNEYITKYNNTIHSSLNGKTPIERKDEDLTNIIYINDEKIENDFLFEIERRVSFDCVVLVDTREYQTPAKFANRKKVKIKYSFDYSKVIIIDDDGREYELEPLNKIDNSMVKRSRLTEIN